jgi:diguanylate cyclase (GGDEF)-like protein
MAISHSAAGTVDLQGLLGALPDAVLQSDTAGKVVFLNPAAQRLIGHTREAALGRPVDEVLPLAGEVDGKPLDSPAAVCLRNNASVGPLEARLLVGTRSASRTVDVTAAPIRDAGGAITGTILIARDITRARQAARQLTHQATHDALTGLVNRTEFERRLTQALASASKEGSRHALGFLDLDGFKRINDACGHHAGDELLRDLSGLLRRRMRTRDTLARLGGDEFGMLLEHCSLVEAVRLAEELRRSVTDQPFTCDGRTFSIGVSVGVVPIRNGGTSTTQLLCAADAACYQAKRQGGNRVHHPAIRNRASSPHLCPTHPALSGGDPEPGNPETAQA